MAGIREQVSDRRKREKASKTEGKESGGELKLRKGRHLLASAARIQLSDQKSIEYNRSRRQSWQSDAWEYVAEIGELSYVVEFMANLQAKVRLFAAIRPEPDSSPLPVNSDDVKLEQSYIKLAMDTLERLRSSQGGQAAIQHDISYNWNVAGECFLHGHEDQETGYEDWNIRSVDELDVNHGKYVLRTSPTDRNGTDLSPDDVCTRLWMKNNRYSTLAYSPLRPLLGVCESIQLLSREIRATAKSRASAGILLMPEELSFGSIDPTRDGSDGEATDDPFIADLIETLVAPIQNEGSAAAVAPMVIRGPADLLDKVRHITLDRPMDDALDGRINNLIMRLARGLNAPVEVTTGLQETTFANAAQVKKSEWDAHGEPQMVMICDALTIGYFRPALIEAQVPEEIVNQLFIWGDPSDAIAAPDPADNAEAAFTDFLISEEARRRIQGFSDDDAPDELETLKRLVTEGRITDPSLVTQILRDTGISVSLEAPQRPSLVAAGISKKLRRDAQGNRLGRKLMQIDRDLRTRLITAADAALKKALDRAGNKVISKAQRDKSASVASIIASLPPRQIPAALGPSLVASLELTDDELLAQAFEQFGSDFDRWVAAAQTGAVNQIHRARPLSEEQRTEIAQKQDADRAIAWESLYTSLMDLARTKLYESSLTAALTPLGEDDGAFEIPASMIRKSMAMAGGDTGAYIDITGAVLGTDDEPVGGIGVSDSLFAVAQIEIEAYQWSHGSPQVPFEPHEALDGQIFIEFADDALSNGFSYPETDSLFPGDHAHCTCDVIPIAAPMDEIDYLFE